MEQLVRSGSLVWPIFWKWAEKQGSKMALNAFLFEKKAVIAEGWGGRQNDGFCENAKGWILDKIGA